MSDEQKLSISSENQPHKTASELESIKTMTHIVYGLQAASFIIGLTFFAAVIVNYIKREETTGTLYESHFRWQIRTFWFGLLWSIIGFAATLIFIGFILLLINAIWILYRIIRGWITLSENRPMYD